MSREKSLEEVDTIFTKYFSLVKTELNGRDRKDFSAPAFAGCPGLGKSRMLVETYYLLQSKVKKDNISDAKNIIPIWLTFNNGNGISDEDIENPVAAFAWRILFFAFINGTGIKQFFLDIKNYSNADLWKTLTIEYALKFLLKTITIPLPDKPILIYLALDEFQHPHSAFPISSSKWDSKKSCLSNVIQELGGLMSSSRNDKFLFTFALAGTDVLGLGALHTDSSFFINRINLPLLTEEDLIKMIPPELFPKVQNHLHKLSGLPQTLVMFLNSNKSFSEFLNAEKDKLSGVIQNNTNLDTWLTFVAYTITQLEPPQEIISEGRKIEKSGWLTFSQYKERTIIQVPYFFLICTASSESSYNLQKLLFQLFSKVDGCLDDRQYFDLWEMFGAYFRALKLESFRFLKKEKITFSEFHFGAQFPKDSPLSNITIEINDCPEINVFHIQEQIGEGSLKDQFTLLNSTSTVNWKENFSSVFVNGARGTGIDIFQPFKSNSESKFLLDFDQRKRVVERNLNWENVQQKMKSLDTNNLSVAYGLFSVFSNSPPLQEKSSFYCVSKLQIPDYYGLFSANSILNPIVVFPSPLNLSQVRYLISGKNDTFLNYYAEVFLQESKNLEPNLTHDSFPPSVLKLMQTAYPTFKTVREKKSLEKR